MQIRPITDTDHGTTHYTAEPRRVLSVPASRYEGAVWSVTVTDWSAVSGADLDPEGDRDPVDLDAALAAHPGSTASRVTHWSTREEADAHARAELDRAMPVAEHPSEEASIAACVVRTESSLAWRVTGADRDLWRVSVAVERVRD